MDQAKFDEEISELNEMNKNYWKSTLDTVKIMQEFSDNPIVRACAVGAIKANTVLRLLVLEETGQ